MSNDRVGIYLAPDSKRGFGATRWKQWWQDQPFWMLQWVGNRVIWPIAVTGALCCSMVILAVVVNCAIISMPVMEKTCKGSVCKYIILPCLYIRLLYVYLSILLEVWVNQEPAFCLDWTASFVVELFTNNAILLCLFVRADLKLFRAFYCMGYTDKQLYFSTFLLFGSFSPFVS